MKLQEPGIPGDKLLQSDEIELAAMKEALAKAGQWLF